MIYRIQVGILAGKLSDDKMIAPWPARVPFFINGTETETQATLKGNTYLFTLPDSAPVESHGSYLNIEAHFIRIEYVDKTRGPLHCLDHRKLL